MKKLALILALFSGSVTYGQEHYAMFNGDAWPSQEALNKFADLCGTPHWAAPAGFHMNPDVFRDVEMAAKEIRTARENWDNRRVFIVPVNSQDINSWTRNYASAGSVICLPEGMRNLLADSPRELEAVIAHEMGHALDIECYNFAQRTKQGQRSCESRADAFALKVLLKAHGNPYAMAGMFGRLEMYYGQTRTNFLEKLTNVISGDHPITPDRIDNVRKWLTHYSQTGDANFFPPALP